MKICNNCNKGFSDDLNFCPECGAALSASIQESVVNPPDITPPRTDVSPGGADAKSYFDGGLLGLIGVRILTAIVVGITFGIAYPWMEVYRQKWIAKHTVVDGYRLTFDGTGGQLFGKYILWCFLTVITFGIYAFWLVINAKKWIAKHTFMTDASGAKIGSSENGAESTSYFDGGLLELIGVSASVLIMSVITFGIGYPWARTFYQKWLTRHTVVSGKRLNFYGTGGQLFGKYILWCFLTVITLGIYGLWLGIKMTKWIAEYTSAIDKPAEKTLTVGGSGSYFDGGLFDWMSVIAAAFVMTGITWGIAFPWAYTFAHKWKIEHTAVDGRRLRFDGKGKELFGKYVRLLIPALVYYLLYVFLIALVGISLNSPFGGESGMRAISLIDIIGGGMSILRFLSLCTMMVSLLWFVITLKKWTAKHTHGLE
ncbi:MAG: DUF898 domain-containing protein [Clostridiales bacterium]|jgi:uncharacterized membrane protein YjgN (DUF898 family)|nr:DUF898 domain-containing protein [Clostridiales bacterium]